MLRTENVYLVWGTQRHYWASRAVDARDFPLTGGWGNSRRLFSIQIEVGRPRDPSVDSVATDGPPVSSETYPRLGARSRLVRSGFQLLLPPVCEAGAVR